MRNHPVVAVFTILLVATAAFSKSKEQVKSLSISGGYAAIHAYGDHSGAVISVTCHKPLRKRFAVVYRYTTVLANEAPATPLEGQPESTYYPQRYFQAGQLTLDILFNYSLFQTRTLSLELYAGGSIGYDSITHYAKTETFYNEDGRKKNLNFFEQSSGLVNGVIYGITIKIDLKNNIVCLFAERLEYHPGMEIAAVGLRIGRRF